MTIKEEKRSKLSGYIHKGNFINIFLMILGSNQGPEHARQDKGNFNNVSLTLSRHTEVRI
jgi:hypothetical protein